MVPTKLVVCTNFCPMCNLPWEQWCHNSTTLSRMPERNHTPLFKRINPPPSPHTTQCRVFLHSALGKYYSLFLRCTKKPTNIYSTLTRATPLPSSCPEGWCCCTPPSTLIPGPSPESGMPRIELLTQSIPHHVSVSTAHQKWGGWQISWANGRTQTAAEDLFPEVVNFHSLKNPPTFLPLTYCLRRFPRPGNACAHAFNCKY